MFDPLAEQAIDAHADEDGHPRRFEREPAPAATEQEVQR